MKKAISVLLVLSMTLSILLSASISLFADSEPELPSENPYRITSAGLYDDKLVAYYDFAGETEEEQLADKAPLGTTADTLEAANVSIADGVATISKETGSYLAIPVESNDTKDLNRKTLYIKFNMTGNVDGQYANDLFGAEDTFRYWLSKNSTPENYLFGGRIIVNQKNVSLTSGSGIPTVPTDTWYYLAVTFEMTSDALVVTTYHSADGTEYVETQSFFMGDDLPSDLVREKLFLIGKHGTTAEDRGTGYNVDEFRIYDSVLSLTEIRHLSYVTPGQGTDSTTLPEAPEQPYRVPVAGLYDQNLVAYCNFEGETAEDQLLDKAPVGLSRDTLSINGSAITIANGIATLDRIKNNYLQMSAASADTKNLNGKTIYIKFNTSGNPTNTYLYDIVGSSDTYRCFMGGNENEHSFSARNIFNPQALSDSSIPNSQKFVSTGSATQLKKTANQWYYMALTFELTETSFVVKTYYSVDGTEYVQTEYIAETTEFPADLIRDQALLIGSAGSSTHEEGATFSVDEIRIYNTILPHKSIRHLSYITPGQATDISTLPADPVEPIKPEKIPPAALYDENLVTYYDFEGDTDVAKTYDKAPAGSKADTLTVSNAVINNGIAYIPSTKGSYLSISKTGDAADLNNKTIYLSFIASGIANPSCDIISTNVTKNNDKSNPLRYWLTSGSGDNNYQFSGGVGPDYSKTGKLSASANVPTTPTNVWYHLAITFQMVDTELVITTYHSADGVTYVETVNTLSAEASNFTNLKRVNDLFIGKVSATTEDRGISYYIDDFRVYDKAFTAAEVANLQYITPGQPTTLPQPEAPDTPTDPSDPTDPDNPTDPSNPTDPEDPTNPEDPTDPSDPTDTNEPTDSNEPTDTKKPSNSNEPTNSPNADTTSDTNDTSDTTTDTTDKKGCASTVSTSLMILVSLVGVGGAVTLRKKED